MKKSILLFLLFFIFSPFIAFSQITKLGSPFEADDIDLENHYITKGNTVLNVRTGRSNTLTLQSMDCENLTALTKFYKIKMPYGFRMVRVAMFNNKAYMFYTYLEKGIVYYQEIDIEKAVFIGNEKELFSSGRSISGLVESEISYDSTKIQMRYWLRNEKVNDKKNKEVMGIKVFDTKFNLLSNAEFEFPYTEDNVNFNGCTVDNYGTTFFMLEVFDPDSSGYKMNSFHVGIRFGLVITGESKVLPSRYEIFSLKVGENKPTKNIVYIGDEIYNGRIDKAPYSIRLDNGPNNKIYCSGYYTDKNKINYDKKFDKGGYADFKVEMDGVYIYEIDSNGICKNLRKSEFAKVGNYEKFEYMGPRFDSNGNFVFFFEKHTTYRYTSGQNVYYATVNADILAVKMNESGKTDWIKRFPRSEIDSFVFYDNKEGYSILFKESSLDYKLSPEDTARRELTTNKKVNERMKEFDELGTNCIVYNIEKNTGSVEKYKLLNTKEDGLEFNIYGSIQISPNDLVMRGKMNGKDVLFKVKLK